jgi:phosphomannomutase
MRLFLFDVDGTLTFSSHKLSSKMKNILEKLKSCEHTEIGIVGGGKYEKIKEQLDGLEVHHLFSESGCVYHKKDLEIHRKNIRKHHLYSKINIILKIALEFISKVDYEITGNFVDLRSGIIYFSLIGMSALQEERKIFMELDKKYNYRKNLINILKTKAIELKIENELDILEGGDVGIGIYPREYDKEQVLESLSNNIYKEIFYFGDKYTKSGNDYRLLNNKRVNGFNINSPEDTIFHLQKFIES